MNKTRILKLPPSGPIDQNIIAETVDALRQGRLVIIPTDTVYGVAADPHNEKAVAMLPRIKKRPNDKPIPILASDCLQIENLNARFGINGRELAGRYWPGPLTIVLPVANEWEGFRIPKHPITLAIIRAAGGLLRVTSANLSGHSPALTADKALGELPEGVSLAVDSGPAPGGVPSTVVKIENEKVSVLREGAIPGEEILAMCANRIK
ncbi:MAG: L-threonylcarbamoyladenylate synthase [Kiritimatiellia bacterium]|nr:L-threonylcarbamoyladenylate synthase [Kiritimatiellia bacterium]